MSYVDVSFLLSDPDFAETVNVTRRTEVIGINGRTTIVPETIQIVGSVAPGKLSPMTRQPEDTYSGQAITVYSKTKLNGPKFGYLPDIINWRGDAYIVNMTYDYNTFTVAECDLIQPVAN